MGTKQRSTKTLRSAARLRGQVALITGATRGIGLAIAHSLADEGCNLILTARCESALTRISRELASAKIEILAHPCDVRDPHAVDALFRSARQRFKRLDILINNAGVAHPNLPVEKLPFPVWKDVLQTNLDGMFLVTQVRPGHNEARRHHREQSLHRRHPRLRRFRRLQRIKARST